MYININFCFTPDRLTGDPKDSLVALDLGGGSTQITFVPIKPDTLTSTPAEYLTTISLLRQNLNLYTHRLVHGLCITWSNPSSPGYTHTHPRLIEGIKNTYLVNVYFTCICVSVWRGWMSSTNYNPMNSNAYHLSFISYLGLGLMAARKAILLQHQESEGVIKSPCVNPIINNHQWTYGGQTYSIRWV